MLDWNMFGRPFWQASCSGSSEPCPGAILVCFESLSEIRVPRRIKPFPLLADHSTTQTLNPLNAAPYRLYKLAPEELCR